MTSTTPLHIDLASLSGKTARAHVLHRLISHTRSSGPLVALDRNVVEYMEEVGVSLMNNQSINSPFCGFWPMIWGSLHSPSKDEYQEVGAAYVEVFGYIGEAICRSGSISVPHWVSINLFLDAYNQVQPRSLFKLGDGWSSKGNDQRLFVTRRGTRLLGLSGSFRLKIPPYEAPHELFAYLDE